MQIHRRNSGCPAVLGRFEVSGGCGGPVRDLQRCGGAVLSSLQTMKFVSIFAGVASCVLAGLSFIGCALEPFHSCPIVCSLVSLDLGWPGLSCTDTLRGGNPQRFNRPSVGMASEERHLHLNERGTLRPS